MSERRVGRHLAVGDVVVTPHGLVGSVCELDTRRPGGRGSGRLQVVAWTRHGFAICGPWLAQALRPADRVVEDTSR